TSSKAAPATKSQVSLGPLLSPGPALKEIVSLNAVAQVARWLEPAAPPRSGRATPYAAVVRAIAWHLRVGGPWRALPPGGPHWRTVYGLFCKWLGQGVFHPLLAGG